MRLVRVFKIRLILVMIFFAFLASCSALTPGGMRASYEAFSVSKQDFEFLEGGKKPIIVKVDDWEDSIYLIKSKGFAAIGSSRFVGHKVSHDEIERLAIEVGASAVLYSIEYDRSKSLINKKYRQ